MGNGENAARTSRRADAEHMRRSAVISPRAGTTGVIGVGSTTGDAWGGTDVRLHATLGCRPGNGGLPEYRTDIR